MWHLKVHFNSISRVKENDTLNYAAAAALARKKLCIVQTKEDTQVRKKTSRKNLLTWMITLTYTHVQCCSTVCAGCCMCNLCISLRDIKEYAFNL